MIRRRAEIKLKGRGDTWRKRRNKEGIKRRKR
jgi:hypothetical protein